MPAKQSRFTRDTRKQIDELSRLGGYHSVELPDGRVIQGLQSLELLRWRISQFSIPDDLTGKRVLDIGAWDGWFSFEMERRGAEVVAVDAVIQERFLAARQLLDSKVEIIAESVYNLTPERFGRFDIVLFLGVLYHLKHPLLALERVCELCTDFACVESYVSDEGADLDGDPVMEFYETTELRGQFDNWVGPNAPCLMAFCRTVGFARVQLHSLVDNRASVSCFRQWAPAKSSGPKPQIICVENNLTRDQSFSSGVADYGVDDYLTVYFKAAEGDLKPESVLPQVGLYASPAAVVHSTGGDGWQVNCKLPPGLSPGWHEVRLRTQDSAWSDPVRISVDLTEQERCEPEVPGNADSVRIVGVADGKSWESNLVRLTEEPCVSIWVVGIPSHGACKDLKVRLNGSDLPSTFLSDPDEEGRRQVNALLTGGTRPGPARLSVVYLDRESSLVDLQLL